MPSQQELLRRQKALGDFGEFVLDNQDIQAILDEGCRLVAEALGADMAKIVQIDHTGKIGLIRAGVGWNAGIVGEQRVSLDQRSSEAYAIETAEPVITKNIADERRFAFPDFMKEHGVVAIVNVPILLPGREPWGVLQVDAREPRDFGEEDIDFLRTYATVLGPIVDRLQTVSSLSETDEKLRLILGNAHGYVIVLSDRGDIITDWLAGSEEIFGWSAHEMIGKPSAVLFTPEDREAGIPERELAKARGEGAAPNVRWHMRRDGRRVFLHGQTVALRDARGAIRGYLKIAQDVTDRKRNEERQAVLLAELQHRVRNVLATVRSLVNRTVTGEAPVEEIREQIEGRIDALARTQALLTRAMGRGVNLEGIVRDELDAQAAIPDDSAISGPHVELSPKAAEVLTLAVHELATNAAKYGALRQEGRLSVRWRVDREQEQDWLRFNWQERNISVMASAELRSGFGTELITRRVPYELKGKARIDFSDEGVDALIEFPLVPGQSILQTGEPTPSADRSME